ncbi:MAG: ParB/RepB/Spo0J family partition protein [Dermatophilaceae bacterium]
MSDKRRGLGRGLGALIPTSTGATGTRPVDVFFPGETTAASAEADQSRREHHGESDAPERWEARRPADTSTTVTDGADDNELRPVPGASYAEVPVDQIRPNPKQPRTVFDEDEMAELVHSIREIGVLQPVVVRPLVDHVDGVRYELIMGERRWRATQQAGHEAIPAIIKATEDDDLLRDALLENLHRSQLNPLEEAAAYQQLLEDFQCTQEQLASRIGRSRPQVSNTLRLLKLPPLVARRVAAGVLSAGHARALLSLEDAAAMERLAQRIVAEGLSVRSVEEIVTLGDDGPRPRPRRPRPGRLNPQLDDISAAVGDHLDTRVGISLGQRKGKMTIEFASMEDLNRILDLLGLRDARESVEDHSDA